MGATEKFLSTEIFGFKSEPLNGTYKLKVQHEYIDIFH